MNPLIKIRNRISDIENIKFTIDIDPDYWVEIEELARYHELGTIRNLHTNSAIQLMNEVDKIEKGLPTILQNLRHLTMDHLRIREGEPPHVGTPATESQKQSMLEYLTKELADYRNALHDVFQLSRINYDANVDSTSIAKNARSKKIFNSKISYEQWLQIHQLVAYENEDGEHVLLFKHNIHSDVFADHLTKFLMGEDVGFLKIELQSKLVGLITVMDWLDHNGLIKNWIELVTTLGIYAGRIEPISKRSLTQTKSLLRKSGFDLSKYYSKAPKPLNRNEIGEQTPSVIAKKLCAQLHQIFSKESK